MYLENEQIMLTNQQLDGNWQVVLWAIGMDNSNWHIYNVKTGKFKKIGRVGAKKTNYYEKAFQVAKELNERERMQ